MSFLLETIRLGLSNLRLHLLRSVLTALGIIFGVAAVIAMVSIGEGSTRQTLAEIERLGAKNIIIRSQKPPENTRSQGGQGRSFVLRYGITRGDLAVIATNFPDAEYLVPVKAVGAQVHREDRRLGSQAFGVTPSLLDVANLRVGRGRYLTRSDLESQEMVCVIGSEIAAKLFPFEEPLDDTIRIDDKVFTVVGILAPVGLSGGAGALQIGRDFNYDIHIPLTTADTVFGDVLVRRESGSFQASNLEVSEIYLTAPTRERVAADAARVTRILQVRHPGMTDLSLVVPYELLEQAKRRAQAGKWIAGMIAGISLLVGGIGIMNIMLATVTERTREIGIRRALGATRRHIIWQFMVETGVLSAAGGLLGVLLGVGISFGLGWIVPQLPKIPVVGSLVGENPSMPTHVTTWSIGIAFLIATATGMVFGIYPARKAAQQDPIVALRHD